MTDFEANILAAYRACSEDDIAHGMTWYESAMSVADSLTPWNSAIGAGIIAALSPMTSWPENIKKARMVVETGETYGLKANVAKARRILNGESPLDVLKGRKVRAFYLNIIGESSAETVTIDRHAIDIALGKVCTDAERSPYFGVKGNRAMVSAYLSVAETLGITGAQLQAIVWVYWRRNVIRAFHGD